MVVVAQAWLIAELVDAGFIQGDGVAQLRRPLVGLGVVLVLRAGLLWITEDDRAPVICTGQVRAADAHAARSHRSRRGCRGESVDR